MSVKKVLSILVIISIIAGCLSFSSVAEKPATIDDSLKKVFSGTLEMPYRLYIPSDYDEAKSYPVLIFLHGSGERGKDNEAQLLNAVHELFTKGYEYMKEAIIIVPQCPDNMQWVNKSTSTGKYTFDPTKEAKAMKTAMEILYDVEENYSVDKDRVYCSGLSLGGIGCWDLMCRYNDVFAAAYIMCGAVDTSKAEFLIDTPLWWVHGEKDPSVDVAGEREMAQRLTELGGTKFIYSEIAEAGHNIWSYSCSTFDVCPWLFSQKLSDRYPDMFKTKIELESENEIEVSGVQENENSVRFLGKVKTLDYSKVGFEYSENGSEYKDMGNTDTVYTNVFGGEKEYKIPEGEYAFGVKLDQSNLNGNITVRPYFIKDGAKTYGKEETVSFENGKIQ